jgi:hypothetical protein
MTHDHKSARRPKWLQIHARISCDKAESSPLGVVQILRFTVASLEALNLPIGSRKRC